MKVIHIPYCYWPDAVGGTEIYVDSLAREQQRQGVDVMIAAPGANSEEYAHNEIPVRRFGVAQTVSDVQELYGEGDLQAAAEFGNILDEEHPDLVHLHALSRGASLRVVREAKRRGIPVVFNYHTPTVTCQRGTLLRWGSEVCDGVLDVTECTRCTLHGHGLNKIPSLIAGSMPSSVGRVLESMQFSGGAWTVARMTELVRVRHNMVRSLMDEVDHIVALCQWVKDVLVRNNVPEAKITVSQQGLDPWTDTGESTHGKPGARPIRIAFLGRLDATKGVHILIKAIAQNPQLDVLLDVFGVTQGDAGDRYLRHLRTLAEGDHRVKFQPPIPSSDVISRLRNYDVLAVPSQCLETGPRVILEAFAAGVPVVGSNLGGIAELVTDGVNGLLVEPDSVAAWGSAFRSICDAPRLLPALRSSVRIPRKVSAVADEILGIYNCLAHCGNLAEKAIATA